MTALGLDGFRKGWVAVCVDGAEHTLHFLKTVTEVDDFSPSRVLIDIPIGLPPLGDRTCDLEAKKLLKKGSPRVFTGARRNFWDFPSQAAANQHYTEHNDKGISAQLWCLGPKIKEVDEFMTSERQLNVCETHPELVFWRLNNNHNAELFVQQHGDDAAYSAEMNTWLLWSGGRWGEDITNQVSLLAESTATSLIDNAAKLDFRVRGERDQMLKHAMKSCSAHSIRNMLEIAEPKLPVKVEQLGACLSSH